MARGNYPVCKGVTLVWEGGDVNHPSDPGGFTSRGVTAAAGASYRKRMGLPPKAVNLWTAAEVDRFYHDDYWVAVGAELLPYGVDLGTWDYGVNSGPSRAGKELQRVVGAKVDGVVGAGTRQAVSDMSGKDVVQKLCARRLSFVQGLGTFKVFGKGWSRRIADIEAKGVAMWLRYGVGMTPAEVGTEMASEASQASGKASGNAKAAGGAGGGGVVVMGGDYAAGGTGWLLVGVVLLVVIGIGLLVKSGQNKARAEAYAAQAGAEVLQ